MELKRSNKLVKWAYVEKWGLGDRLPTQVGLCSLVWRVFFLSPVTVVVLGAVALVLSPIWVPIWAVYKVWEHWNPGNSFDAYLDRITNRFPNTLLGSYVVAAHSKVCPIIKLED